MLSLQPLTDFIEHLMSPLLRKRFLVSGVWLVLLFFLGRFAQSDAVIVVATIGAIHYVRSLE